jgi:hypothetical protein
MLLAEGCIHLASGPREHGHRPAIDPLFRTAARTYGARVVGVLLSGTLDDGTEGLLVIKRHHGVTVVQDPAEALYPGMPNSAIAEVGVDHVEPVARIGSLLVRLTTEAVALADQASPLAALDARSRRRRHQVAGPGDAARGAIRPHLPEVASPLGSGPGLATTVWAAYGEGPC